MVCAVPLAGHEMEMCPPSSSSSVEGQPCVDSLGQPAPAPGCLAAHGSNGSCLAPPAAHHLPAKSPSRRQHPGPGTNVKLFSPSHSWGFPTSLCAPTALFPCCCPSWVLSAACGPLHPGSLRPSMGSKCNPARPMLAFFLPGCLGWLLPAGTVASPLASRPPPTSSGPGSTPCPPGASCPSDRDTCPRPGAGQAQCVPRGSLGRAAGQGPGLLRHL